MAESADAVDLKSTGPLGHEGSNPSAPTLLTEKKEVYIFTSKYVYFKMFLYFFSIWRKVQMPTIFVYFGLLFGVLGFALVLLLGLNKIQLI